MTTIPGKKQRILVLAANPRKTIRLDLENEINKIEERIKASNLEFTLKLAAQPDELQSSLLLRPQFIHFCGHGKGQEGIVFEDENRNMRLVRAEPLSRLFALFSSHVKCVFLNACFSDVQARVISKKIEYVIGMQGSIQDESAIKFTAAFYEALSKGESIPFSFAFAREAIEINNLPDYAVPILIQKGEPQPTPSKTLVQKQGVSEETSEWQRKVNHLLNTISKDTDVIFLLGEEASREGRQRGEAFPTFTQIVDRILEDNGMYSIASEKLNSLHKLLVTWDREATLPLYLRDYIQGTPGYAHYCLAALAVALLYQKKAPLFLTTMPDEMIKRALDDISREQTINTPQVFDIAHQSLGSDSATFFEYIESHRRSGSPVVMKLIRTLDPRDPIFSDLYPLTDQENYLHLQDWFRQSIVVIGYDFSDEVLRDLFLSTPSKRPVFLITTSSAIPSDIIASERVYLIKENFPRIATSLIRTIRDRHLDRAIKIDQILRQVEPAALISSVSDLCDLVETASRASLERVREKLPKDTAKQTNLPISITRRKDTGPDVQGFLASNRALLVIVGDSGSGKSTFLYQIALDFGVERDSSSPLVLFYDAHHLQTPSSLSARLARDFHCPTEKLDYLLSTLGNSLGSVGRSLLILVDAINESVQVSPTDLRMDIEDLASRLPPRIKIAYTCRRVIWDTFIKGMAPLPASLYYGSQEFILTLFSSAEAADAFLSYKRLYRLQGSYNSLAHELKEKTRDPLMLRMLAEGYRGKPLPDFAPAVLIFHEYEHQLERYFVNTSIMLFLRQLIQKRSNAALKGQHCSDQFSTDAIRLDPDLHRLIVQQHSSPLRSGEPLLLLEDEGVLTPLDSSKNTYRFTYDRFFEYMLGKELGRHIGDLDSTSFVDTIVDVFNTLKANHFSFQEGLKSEIIRRHITPGETEWPFCEKENLRQLLGRDDALVVNFTKDVLRELHFEADLDIFDLLASLWPQDHLRWKLLALDLASDSPKVLQLLTTSLLEGNTTLVRRTANVLSKLINDPHLKRDFEAKLLEHLKEASLLSDEQTSGLIYYSALLLPVENASGRDAWKAIKEFWRELLLKTTIREERIVKYLTDSLIKLIDIEAPYFFGAEARIDGFEYLWNQDGRQARELAMELLPYLADPQKPITNRAEKIILHFASERRIWLENGQEQEEDIYVYKLEHIIAMWLLALRSVSDFPDVVQILARFVETGHWLTIDFTLNVMEILLRHVHYEDIAVRKAGFKAMEEWTSVFEERCPEFYAALTQSDPFSFNYIPVASLAIVDADFFSPANGPIHSLEKRLTSNDSKKMQLSLLATRYLWRRHPLKVLGTLQLVKDVKDSRVAEWFERIIREMYQVHPRIVEEYFTRSGLNPERARRIKHQIDILEGASLKYEVYPLAKTLFFRSEDRRISALSWYQRILTSPDLRTYCSSLISDLLERIAD